MTTLELEKRITALEKKVETLAVPHSINKNWVLKMWGSFSGDPDFEKAMHYGRQWRDTENRRSIRARKPVRARKSRQ